ncbi:MAG: PAS domain S-box protein, partial [Magnetococcales bacterium]|nr:PAS domain S-box protein [Magnetococcales bacterium]
MIHFITSEMDRSLAYPGFYDPALVLFSLMAAFLGCLTGLSTLDPLRQAHGPKRMLWLLFGATALGLGTFLMHFIGMLAYRLPIDVYYEVGMTALSTLPALLSSGWMLHLAGHQQARPVALWIGGTIAGIGIGLMHHLGMMAMHLQADIRFDPLLFVISLLCAVALAILAIQAKSLTQALHLKPDSLPARLLGPLVMAISIAGMHYLAMSATRFFPGSPRHASPDLLLDPDFLLIGLAILFFVLILLLLISFHLRQDRRESARQWQRLGSAFHRENRKLLLGNTGLILTVLLFGTWITTALHDTTEMENRILFNRIHQDHLLQEISHTIQTLVAELDRVAARPAPKSPPNAIPEPMSRAEVSARFSAPGRAQHHPGTLLLLDLQGETQLRLQKSGGDPVILSDDPMEGPPLDPESLQSLLALKCHAIHFSMLPESAPAADFREGPFPLPVLQLAAPVVGSREETTGVALLRYPGALLQEILRKNSTAPHDFLYIIDREGRLLFPPHPKEPWSDPNFAAHFPILWKFLPHQDSGSFRTPEGHFLFANLNQALPDTLKSRLSGSDSWTLVTRIQPEPFTRRHLNAHPIFATILYCSILLGLVLAWGITLTMLSRRRLANSEAEALRELEFQKLALDEHAIVSATDVRGDIIYANDKFVAISGYTREALMGRNHRMIKSQAHTPEFYRELWRTITSGRTWHGEVQNLAKDGTPYWVRATVVP